MNQINGKIYLFCAFSLAGTSVISARLLTGKLGTYTVTAASLFFALLFLIPLCSRQLARYVRSLSFIQIIFLSLQALCGIFLFRVFLLNGLIFTSTAEAGILTGATPAITAILAMVVLKEQAGGKKILGILSTVGGILIIQGVLTPGNGLSLEHISGNMLVLCAAASESAFNMLSRISAVKTAAHRKEPANPMAQTAIVSAIALILCLAPALFEDPVQTLSKIGPKEWLALIWYGVFVTALAFICWYAGIKRCSALTAAAFSGMMPFTSMILSAAILKESPGWQQWAGGALVVAGMILIGTGSADAPAPVFNNIKIQEKEQVKE
jgi:drug/metabolite transporter (DMT)-like permease